MSSFVNLPLWLCVSLCLYLHPLVSLSVSVFVSYFWSMLLFEPFCTSFIHLPPSHSLFLPYWFCLNTHLSWCSYLWNELRLFVFRESSPQSASLSLYLSPSICTPDWLCLCCKMFHLTNLASKQASHCRKSNAKHNLHRLNFFFKIDEKPECVALEILLLILLLMIPVAAAEYKKTIKL